MATRRRMWAASAILAGVVVGVAPAGAGNWVEDQRARQVAEAATAVVESTLRWCDGNRSVLSPPVTARPPTDPAWLRQACGRTLTGRVWPNRDPWRYVFWDVAVDDGRLEGLGLGRAIAAPRGPWRVMVGLMWRVHRPPQAAEEVTRTPVADLLRREGDAWRLVWRYLSEDGRAARLPQGAIAGPSVPPDAAEAVRHIWREVIAGEFRVWAREFLDARGVPYKG